jgi:hypothetical protein
MLSLNFRSRAPNVSAADAKPVSVMFMKSGLRPNMPQVASIQVFTMLRRRIRSSIDFGWMNDNPTRSPLVGDGKVSVSRSAGSCCIA